ncbi:hypothetical protein [Streptomyces sp. Ncost-T6T-1]|nr:hypothetical protein [Streptomyces sp. Ncost-T6T-1]
MAGARAAGLRTVWVAGAVRMRARCLHVPDNLLEEVVREIGKAI